ncbi:hypothetical protein H0H92_006691 [Tricholoma furcatifolium]|nr:hypothetical protein H0H92_006691 [Tricholoma furcatifolium]
MSLFGAPAAAPTGGLFGAPNPLVAAPTLPAFGNTGAASTTPAAGGGLFGQASTTTATGGGLFGAQQQQQPAPAGGGLFGAAQTQPAAAGGGLFGAQAQQTQPTPAQPAATTGPGLFGASQPATGGGLFGASTTTQPATGGSLFGAPVTQPAAAAGGGLFGAPTTTQPAAGGGLFGASTTQPAATTGGGLFGASKPGLSLNTGAAAPATTTTNPLFGGAAPAASGSLFGQTTTAAKPSIFGQSTSPAPALAPGTSPTPLFGSAAGSSTLGMSALGGPGASMLGRTATGPGVQQVDAQSQHLVLLQRIEGIYGAWNPQSPSCRFQHAFYNIVDPARVAQFQRPQNVSNELWEKARKENPNPSCFVPVFATGFDDLRARVDAQSAQSEKLKERLTDLKKRIDALTERHALSNVSRLQRAQAQQIHVTQRLLAFARHLHLLIPAIRSSAFRPEEEQLRRELERVEDEIRRGRLGGKLNELWALIGAVSASAERGRSGDGNAGEWAVVDEEGLAQIAQILSDQQAGLAHLTKVLQKTDKDLDVILATPNRAEDGGAYADPHSHSWGSASSSTLRASALR